MMIISIMLHNSDNMVSIAFPIGRINNISCLWVVTYLNRNLLWKILPYDNDNNYRNSQYLWAKYHTRTYTHAYVHTY